MNWWLKYLSVFALSAVKFLGAAPLAKAYKLHYAECFVLLCLGGMTGVYLFAMFTKPIMRFFYSIRHKLVHEKNRIYSKPRLDADGKITVTYTYVSKKQLEAKRFNPSVRKLLKLWHQYGLAGIAFLTPIIISIPIGSFIAARLERNKHKIFFYMSVAVVFWALVLTAAFYTKIPFRRH